MNQLMTPQQVGAEYGVTVQELAEWRRKKIGPAYYVLGKRVIRYLPDNVEAPSNQTGSRNVCASGTPAPSFSYGRAARLTPQADSSSSDPRPNAS